MRNFTLIVALVLATQVYAAGGIVVTSTVNHVTPDHPSMQGTYWGWNFKTNLAPVNYSKQVSVINGPPSHRESFLNVSTLGANAINGYACLDRRDPTIDFTLGSSLRAELLNISGATELDLGNSPVPGVMLGIQDKNGRFFGVGIGQNSTHMFIRLINNPFTGAGTAWQIVPNTDKFYRDYTNRYYFSIELVIAGSQASVLVSGSELKDSNGNILRLDAGQPLNSLIFTQWVSYGGVIVGDYCTTDAGGLNLYSLSYY
jgi:hypothetical protein